MANWISYLKEQKDTEVLETEDGFVTFKYFPKEVYIEDIYVIPERRRSHAAFKMADKVAEIARSKGYRVMTGTVCPSGTNAHTSLLVLLGYGMKLLRAEDNLVWFYKEL